MSVRILAWLTAALSAGASVLMWLNVSGFAAALGESAARRMTAGAAATSGTAIVLLGLAAAHYSFGRRGSRVGAALLAIAVFGSLALAVAARGPAVAALAARTAIRAVAGRRAGVGPARRDDSARRRVARLRVAAHGRRPAAELRAPARRLARRWTWPPCVRLARTRCGRRSPPACIRPRTACGRRPNTTSAATPRPFALLPDHCFSHVLVQLGLLRRESNSSASLRARPLWSILAMAGISAGIVRWPLTYPGAAGPRLRAERSLSPTPRIGPRARCERRVSSRGPACRQTCVCRPRRDSRLAAVSGRRRRRIVVARTVGRVA